MLTVSRVQANSIGAGGSICLPGSTKIHEQSLADMQEVGTNNDVSLTTGYNRFGKFDLKSVIFSKIILMVHLLNFFEPLSYLICYIWLDCNYVCNL